MGIHHGKVTGAILFLLLFAGCGANSGAGQSNLVNPVAPPTFPSPNPNATPNQSNTANQAANSLGQNLTSCAQSGGFANAQSAQSSINSAFSAGQSGSTTPTATTGTQCVDYANQAAQELGLLAGQGAYSRSAIQQWLSDIASWAFNQNSNTPGQGTSGAIAPDVRQAILAVSVTASGAHTNINSPTPGCPAGTAQLGNIADCGGGTCYGNQLFCEMKGSASNYQGEDASPVPVVTDFISTASGAHTNINSPTPGCPTGYTTVGGAADCGGGNCYGNQMFCETYVGSNLLNPGDRYVVDVQITTSGAHQNINSPSPGCPAGYQQTGGVADCGGGTCYGNQLICVLYGSW